MRYQRGIREQALVIGHLESLHRTGITAHSASHVSTRAKGEQIGSHLAQLSPHTLLGALSDSHHDDDGSHSNDDSQHAEEGAELIAQYCVDGNFE